MNRYDWNNPPPPGTEFDSPDEDGAYSSQKNIATSSSNQGSSQIDSFIKSPASQGRDVDTTSEKSQVRSRSKSRSRSRSPERRRRRRHSRSYSRRSRSYSRDRRKRSRSKSRRRRRRYSSSRSRSRSRSSGYRHRHKKYSRRYSRSSSMSRSYSRKKSRSYRSRTRSESHSRSQSRTKSYKSERDKKSPRSQHNEERRDSDYSNRELDGDIIGEEDMKIENPDEEQEAPVLSEPEPQPDQGPIPFKNDGSFLEMFKKMQEQKKATEEAPKEATVKKPLLPTFGKRRGGKVLKTGMVAKVRNIEEETNNAQDAWTVYMKEVRKYKEVHCDDDSKTRPLVK